MKSIAFGVFFVCVAFPALMRGQQIRIAVIDSRHGKPVTDECLNVSLGPWHGADILAPTNKQGVVVLTIDTDRVSAEPVAGNTCNGMPSTKTRVASSLPTNISIVSDNYVSCQYSKKLTSDPAWLRKSSAERVPVFAIKDILDSGVIASNACSQMTRTAKPGELVFIVRKRTFLEGMKS